MLFKGKFMRYLIGLVEFQTDRDIFEVANLISEKIFSGLKFGGFEESIYEEIPALYLTNTILGTKVVLSGQKGFLKDNSYLLEIKPVDVEYHLLSETIDIQSYLEDLFKVYFDFKIINESNE